MTQINKIAIDALSEFKDATLISHPDFAINRGVRAAVAIGRVMKRGEPERIIGYNTCQVTKYDNYELGSFSEESKHAWRDEHWEEDLQKAYDADTEWQSSKDYDYRIERKSSAFLFFYC